MKKYKNLVWLFAILGLTSCGSVLSPQAQRPTVSYQIVDSQLYFYVASICVIHQ